MAFSAPPPMPSQCPPVLPVSSGAPRCSQCPLVSPSDPHCPPSSLPVPFSAPQCSRCPSVAPSSLPALPVPSQCPSVTPSALPVVPVPPTALSPPSSPQIPHCPPLTGHTRGLGVPRARSTQHSCSMSFSPGKRGDRLSSSPKMQPTALRMSTQGGHHHGGGDTPIFGDIHSGDTNVEHKFGGMNSGIQI